MKNINAINELLKIGEKNNDDLFIELLKGCVESFISYKTMVAGLEIEYQIQKIRLEQKDYCSYITKREFRRKQLHDTCIKNISIINRQCKLNGIKELYSNDENQDRTVIADFIGLLV